MSVEVHIGRCCLCGGLAACKTNGDLICQRPLSVQGWPKCKADVCLFPYVNQPALSAAYMLGGIEACERMVREEDW